jgi:hypothetical protein
VIIHECLQGSPEWFKLRAAKPTSSLFSNLVTGTGKPSDGLSAYAHKLGVEKHLGHAVQDFSGNKYTQRGTDLEPLARADYEMTHQVEVQEVGFITDDLMRWGASTDGLVGDDGLVEFKNLIETEFGKLMLYVAKHGKTQPKYVPQVQGELFVTGRDWADIVFCNPAFEAPITFRHYPIPEFHKVLEAQLKKCIAERNVIAKELNKFKFN